MDPDWFLWQSALHQPHRSQNGSSGSVRWGMQGVFSRAFIEKEVIIYPATWGLTGKNNLYVAIVLMLCCLNTLRNVETELAIREGEKMIFSHVFLFLFNLNESMIIQWELSLVVVDKFWPTVSQVPFLWDPHRRVCVTLKVLWASYVLHSSDKGCAESTVSGKQGRGYLLRAALEIRGARVWKQTEKYCAHLLSFLCYWKSLQDILNGFVFSYVDAKRLGWHVGPKTVQYSFE